MPVDAPPDAKAEKVQQGNEDGTATFASKQGKDASKTYKVSFSKAVKSSNAFSKGAKSNDASSSSKSSKAGSKGGDETQEEEASHGESSEISESDNTSKTGKDARFRLFHSSQEGKKDDRALQNPVDESIRSRDDV